MSDKVESKVPGEQQLRGTNSNEIALNDNDKKDDVLTPVLTVTKEETTWTKGGMKLQKVVVGDEKMDESIELTTITEMVSTNQNSVTSEIYSEAKVSTTKQYFDQNNNTPQETKTKDDNKDSKKITKIPKLKQAGDKLKKDQASQENPTNEPQVVKKIQSAIPRLKDIKQAQNTQTEINNNQNQDSQKEQQQQQQQPQQQLQREESLKLDDEFDKLYEEIVEQDSSSSSIPTPVKFEELLKSDTKFEDIIHSYEDSKVQYVTEKVKSKIPLLKRKSEVEIEDLPTNRRGSLRKSFSSDDSTSKIAVASKDKTTKIVSETKFKRSNSKSESNTENKSEIKVDTQTKFIRNNSTSESYTTENKSETVLESVTTNVTKVITAQISTEKQVSVTSTEDVRIKRSNSTDISKDVLCSKDISKCKIPVSVHTKKNIERKVSNNVEKVSEQATTGTGEIFAVDQNEESHAKDVDTVNKEEIKSDANVKVQEELSPVSQTTVENKSETGLNFGSQELNTKLYTSLLESNSSNQSPATSNNNVSTTKTNDDAKLSEISKVNTEIQNQVTEEVNKTHALDLESTPVDITTLNESAVKGNATITSKVTPKEVVTAYTSEVKIEIAKESKVSNSVSLEIQNDSNTVITHIADTSSDIPYKTEKVNNLEENDIKNNQSELENIKTTEDVVEVNSKSKIGNVTSAKILNIDNIKETIAQESTIETMQPQAIQKENIDVVTDNKVSDSKNIEISEQAKKKEEQSVQAQTIEKENVVVKNEIDESKNIDTSIFKKTEEQNYTNKLQNINSNDKALTENNNISNNVVDKDIETRTNEVNKQSTTHILASKINNIEDLEEEDIIILKGKVNRIISRLDSKTARISRTEVDDLPTNISVSSKIATFEKSDSTNTDNKVNTTPNRKIDIKGNKPKIVDELLKKPDNVFDFNINKNTNKYQYESEKRRFYKSNSYDYEIKLDKDVSAVYDNNSNLPGNYERIYNKVHSSIINRLNSIENKFSRGVFQEIPKNESLNVIHEKNLKETSSVSEPNISIKNVDDDNGVFTTNNGEKDMYKEYRPKKVPDADKRAKSVAELDIGDSVKGRVRQMVYRMNSMERMRMLMRSDTTDRKDRLRKVSINDRVALFEKKSLPTYPEETTRRTVTKSTNAPAQTITEEQLKEKIAELSNARHKYQKFENMSYIELGDGTTMPAIAIGTALLEPKLVKHIVSTAIELGYRAIDTAYIYGNESAVGEAIKAKIAEGIVKREELFVISKLWSTFHRRDLVMKACRQSLENMGLDYFDLYLIHNPMSFKEGSNPLPKIANVLQYSQHDYLEAWYGVEDVIRKGLAKSGGVSNFNSVQVERVVEKGKIKPVINQIECHPYLTQQRLEDFCSIRNVKLSCYGVLGSKGTPDELKSGLSPVIDDPLVKVMSAGLGITPAQLLIAYQLQAGRNVVVKASSPQRLWDNLQAIDVKLDQAQVSALNALNRNKRTFTFQGMGDTHRNYPFKIAF